MSDPFVSALDYVHSAVAQMHARGLPLTASMESLAKLAALAGSVPASAAASPTPSLSQPAAPVAERRPVQREVPVAAPAAVKPAAPAPAAAPVAPPRKRSGNTAADLDALRMSVAASKLGQGGANIVFGVGNPEAELMFIGDVPGEEEAQAGEPFVGLDGQLLTKIIGTMGFQREQVYLTNVLKFRREDGTRKPTAAEMRPSLPCLEEQVAIIQPRVIVALGATVMEALFGMTDPMARLRGKWHDFRGTPLMATYHPGYLLRNQSLTEKRKVWEDMLLVLEKLGRPISDKQRAFFLPKR